MKKRFGAVIMLAVFMITTLAGCMSMEATIDTTKSKKNYRVSMTVWYDKETIDGLNSETVSQYLGEDAELDGEATINDADLADIKNLPVDTINGKQYYRQDGNEEKGEYFKGKPEGGVIVRKDSFYADEGLSSVDLDGEADESSQAFAAGLIDRIAIRVIFDKKIKTTNGKLSKNKKSVSYEYSYQELLNKKSKKNNEIYAYTYGSESSLKEDRAIVKKYNQKQKSKKK